MTQDLKSIAMKMFERTAPVSTSNAIGLDSLTVHLRENNQTETLLLHGRGDSVGFTCTCGEENCRHARWLLQWLLEAKEAFAPVEADSVRRSEPPTQRPSVSGSLRVIDNSDGPMLQNRALVAERLEDLVTAVVRVGTQATNSPSVEDALKRLINAAPQPLPLGFERWLGRIKTALTRADLHRLARVLYGGCLSAEALRHPHDPSQLQLAAWFGTQRQPYEDVWQANRLQDQVLMEIAREWLPGNRRAGIERRYLVHLDTGEVFCEDRQAGDVRVSSGPCPRLLQVGLAHIEPGIPKRIRLFQYVVSGRISPGDWASLKLTAIRRFRPLVDTYRAAVKSFPALAEPFVVVKPARFERDEVPIALDEEDMPLPIAVAENPAEVDCLSRVLRRGEVQWMAGRLVDADNCLMLRVRSLATLENHELRHHRIS